jgi:hypothetical protein
MLSRSELSKKIITTVLAVYRELGYGFDTEGED